MKQARQVRPLASEPIERRVDSPYLRADECAAYLRFASVAALYKALTYYEGTPHAIPYRRRGRTFLFHKAELDTWLAGEMRRGHDERQSPALRLARKG